MAYVGYGITVMAYVGYGLEALILDGFDVGAFYERCAALGWSTRGGHGAAVARELGLGSECGGGAGSRGADGGGGGDGSDGGGNGGGDSLEDAVLVLADMLGYTPLGAWRRAALS